MWWLGLLVVPSLAFAFTPPPNDGFVTDAVPVLTTEEELSLENMLQQYAEETGTELAVIFVKNVGTDSIERAAKDIAARWRIGIDGEARGVVMLLSYEDRDFFMVIGGGLEGVLLPDIAQGIIARDMIPLFRDGEYADGIREGVSSIIKHISGEYTSARYDSSPPSSLAMWLTSIVGIAGVVMMLVFLRGFGGRTGVRRRRPRVA